VFIPELSSSSKVNSIREFLEFLVEPAAGVTPVSVIIPNS
jgi:hypothetical protein